MNHEVYLIVAACRSDGQDIGPAHCILGESLFDHVDHACMSLDAVGTYIVISNDPLLHKQLRGQGRLFYVHCPRPLSDDTRTSFFPLGTCLCLASHVDIPPDAVVVLVSSFAPHVRSEHLQEALERVLQGKDRLVLSMNPCRDHPILFNVQPHLHSSFIQYPLDHLWKVKGATVMDSRTGKALQHRQDYPFIAEANRNFLVFRYKDWPHLSALVYGGSAGFEMTTLEHSITVEDGLGLLEFQLLREKNRMKWTNDNKPENRIAVAG